MEYISLNNQQQQALIDISRYWAIFPQRCALGTFRRYCTNISLRKYIHYSDISDTQKRKRNNYVKTLKNNQNTAINASYFKSFCNRYSSVDKKRILAAGKEETDKKPTSLCAHTSIIIYKLKLECGRGWAKILFAAPEG